MWKGALRDNPRKPEYQSILVEKDKNPWKNLASLEKCEPFKKNVYDWTFIIIA